MAVHERDWDTAFPSEDEPDEHDTWKPDKPVSTTVHLKSHAISTFNRSASLAVHLGRVIIQLYGACYSLHLQGRALTPCAQPFESASSVRAATPSSRTSTSNLQGGTSHCRRTYSIHQVASSRLRFSSCTPTSTPLCSYCIVPCEPSLHVLVLFPGLTSLQHAQSLSRRDAARCTESFNRDDRRQCHRQVRTIASYILGVSRSDELHSIVTVYSEAYGLRRAMPQLIYYVFSAAIMHVRLVCLPHHWPRCSCARRCTTCNTIQR